MTRTWARVFLIPVGILAVVAGRATLRGAAPSEAHPNQRRSSSGFAKLTLSFETKLGQFDPRVLFAARSSGEPLFFTRHGLTMALLQATPEPVGGIHRSGHISIHRPA